MQAILNLVACALGPLLHADLLCLAPPEADLNTWTLENSLQPLSRFLIGDGRTQGYVFAHPRLGGYFYDLLTPAERHQWESRFIKWGQDTIEALRQGGLLAGDVPGYLS